jgi:hypothetical protein
MKTDALIAALAHDIQPIRLTPTWRRFAAAGLVGAALASLVVWVVFGVREHLSDAMFAVLTKSAYSLVAVAIAAPLAYALSQPNTRIRAWIAPAIVLIVASLLVAGFVVAMAPTEQRLSVWLAGGFPECLRRIPMLAAPVAVALLFVVRGLTPTRLTFAGAAVGGLAGAIAAVAYSWFCPVDSVAYVATWYLAAILLCAGLGAVFGRWLLRW